MLPNFEVAAGPADPDLKTVSDLAAAQVAAEDVVLKKTRELREAVTALDYIRDQLLPDAMTRCGFRDYTLLDGRKLTCSDKYIAGKLATTPGLAWVADHGGGELAKTTVTVELPKGSADDAKQLIDLIRTQPYANKIQKMTAEEYIHNATLSSWVNRAAKDGLVLQPDDLELIGAYRMRRTKVGSPRFTEVELKGLVAK